MLYDREYRNGYTDGVSGYGKKRNRGKAYNEGYEEGHITRIMSSELYLNKKNIDISK